MATQEPYKLKHVKNFVHNVDKPSPLDCCTHKPNLPGRFTMLRSHTPLRLIPCTLLLVVSISGESQRDMAHSDTPGTGRMDDQRVLEAVKKEILSSLNMDREPRPTQKASRRRLNTMYELYRERIYEMEKNSSQSLRDPWRSTMTTVLYPSLGEVMMLQQWVL